MPEDKEGGSHDIAFTPFFYYNYTGRTLQKNDRIITFV